MMEQGKNLGCTQFQPIEIPGAGITLQRFITVQYRLGQGTGPQHHFPALPTPPPLTNRWLQATSGESATCCEAGVFIPQREMLS